MKQLSLLALTVLLTFNHTLIAEDEISFSRDIRPILSDKCFACHGPEEASREAGIRFDKLESVLGEADSGMHPVVPGKPDESELITRITAADESLRMPPRETNKPLTADEIELLKKWIASGAAWEDHWAFVSPTLPTLPDNANDKFVSNEIDQFILDKLQKKNLKPSPRADKETLIRRVTFDLTGLPPTPEEVTAFVGDTSPEAYEKLVDRLLASPRFGEHVGRFWLDAARYGDTHGLHLDNYREMWPYRDWVISAFNQNMPFDQFIIEQVAGDLLPNPTDDQLIATGFNRAHVTTSEGGSIAAEVRMRNVVDRVVTFGTVFMGATFDCTRCHDHKFDPLTQEDFYSLYAYFNSIDGNPLDGNKKDHAPVLKVPTQEQREQLAALDEKLVALRAKLNADWPELKTEQAEWEAKVSSEMAEAKVEWSTLHPETYTSSGGAEIQRQEDDSLLFTGPNAAKDNYEVVGTLSEAGWRGVRLEGLLDPANTNGGAGRSSNSNVVLTEFEVYTAPQPQADEEPKWTRIKIEAASADHEQSNGDFKVSNAIDGNPQTGWAIEGHVKKEPRTALFRFQEALAGDDKQLIKIVLKHESVYGQHQFGRIRLALTKQNPIRSDIPDDIANILQVASAERDEKQNEKLTSYFRDTLTENSDFIAIRDEVKKVEKERTDLDNTVATTLIWKEKAKPEQAFMLNRGEYDQPGAEVSRRTPAFLPPMQDGLPNDRLGLAKWLVDEEHPLTARVTVNRFWQQFFGIGLVKTAEDFGSQGESPSHPKLLDWLSVQFMHEGWDVKRMMKRIVMSNTYCQSSKVTPELVRLDPANRLLARGPRYRLDAEMLRDQALYVSGLLIEQMGGPSVKPPQPDGLWFAVGYSGSNTVRFKPDQGNNKIHRRTVYTFIKRTAPPPQMNVFDAPSRESCTVRRERTNTPLQALLLFNDPQYIETAIGLASRAIDEGGSSDQAIAERMLSLTLARTPETIEIQSLVQGVQEDLAAFQQSPENAKQLLEISKGEIGKDKDPARLAAWTMAANLLLNLDEVVTKN